MYHSFFNKDTLCIIELLSIIPSLIAVIVLNIFFEEQLGGYATLIGILGVPAAFFVLFMMAYLLYAIDIKNSQIFKGLCMIIGGLVNLIFGAARSIVLVAKLAVNTINNIFLLGAKIINACFVYIFDMILSFDFRDAFLKVKKNLPHILLGFGTFSIIFAISRNHLLEMSKDFIGLFTQSQELVNILGYIGLSIIGLSLFTGLVFASEKLLRPVSSIITGHHHYDLETQQPSRTASIE